MAKRSYSYLGDPPHKIVYITTPDCEGDESYTYWMPGWMENETIMTAVSAFYPDAISITIEVEQEGKEEED